MTIVARSSGANQPSALGSGDISSPLSPCTDIFSGVSLPGILLSAILPENAQSSHVTVTIIPMSLSRAVLRLPHNLLDQGLAHSEFLAHQPSSVALFPMSAMTCSTALHWLEDCADCAGLPNRRLPLAGAEKPAFKVAPITPGMSKT